jgi:phosphatidylserine/phosphatidylglycerophosphate/cardiolipin synthase-like enzyme
MRRAAWLLALCLAPCAQAAFTIPGYELVQSVPLGTTLSTPDLRAPEAVWSELFDGAAHEIVLGQFYVASHAGSSFEAVLARLEAAGKRGVKIRFLLDAKGVGMSEPDTLARLRAIPHLELRVMDYAQLTARSVIHAKYIVVDGKRAFIGSQNFDWRSFSHIHETGLLISDAAMVRQVQAVFEQDWQAQALLAAGRKVPVAPPRALAASAAPPAQLLASPAAYNPPGVADSQAVLPELLAAARSEVRIQLLDYVPLSFGEGGARPYYGVIDNALRAAAARGVKIKLAVSHWNAEKPGIFYLKSLAMLPNVEIKMVTLPPAAEGPVPYARVIHSKTMTIDGKLAWIGTSNWAGGYMDNSRNLEVVLRSEAMAQRLSALQEQVWSSPYAQPLDINKDYPKPNKGNTE